MKQADFYTNDTFIESPIFDNWFKKHYPQKSLLICSPYIKSDALDKIINLYDLDKRANDFDLKILMRGNSAEFTHQKSSDISIFDTLICLKGFDLSNIKRVLNLHMKAYLVDEKYLLITSGNLTNSGLFVESGKENFEGGISTSNPRIITYFLKYFGHIWKQGEQLDEFYDSLINNYKAYIATEYSDKETVKRLVRRKYKFQTKTDFGTIDEIAIDHRKAQENQNKNVDPNPSYLEIILKDSEEDIDEVVEQKFTLSDIPPVGTLEHIPEVLKITENNPEGITYADMGEHLRKIFSDSDSTEIGANRKFGEEKGKFAAFLNLVNIEPSKHGNLIKINNLGRAYMSMDEDSRNKIIKDIFFNKPIIVSIMRKSFETPNFDLFDYLLKNCDGATRSTLSRKVRPLRELFAHISSICTEAELQSALTIL